jgi:hypothetical protein
MIRGIKVTEIDVDGHIDEKGIRYLGKAAKQPDGTWRCLADVGGALCLVEVRITVACDVSKGEQL